MHPPATRSVGKELAQIFSENEHRQNPAYAVNQIRPQEPGVVVLKQLTQTPVAHGANDHPLSVR